jgi:hypothetical protein
MEALLTLLLVVLAVRWFVIRRRVARIEDRLDGRVARIEGRLALDAASDLKDLKERVARLEAQLGAMIATPDVRTVEGRALIPAVPAPPR